MRAERRSMRRRRGLRLAIASLLFVVVTVTTAYLTAGGLPGGRRAGVYLPGGRFTVLVVGADKPVDDEARTDTMLLVSVDPRAPSVGILSIPRDTYSKIPGRDGYDKVNAAYALGGMELAAQTVERLLDVPVHYYVEMDFDGFIRMVDAIGGVELTVEKPMHYVDRSQGLNIDISAGRQHLDGEQSLHYVRYRGDGLGDVALVDPTHVEYDGRIPRQEKFMQALMRSVLRPSTLLRIPELIGVARDSIDTDIPLAKMTRLAMLARNIDLSDVEMGILPGVGKLVDGVSYWVPDAPQVERVVRELVLGYPQVAITILNGNGEQGLAVDVAELVRDRGLYVASIGNAESFNEPFTRVLAAESAKEIAEQVAGLTGGVVLLHEGEQEEGITVVLGNDYEPGAGRLEASRSAAEGEGASELGGASRLSRAGGR